MMRVSRPLGSVGERGRGVGPRQGTWENGASWETKRRQIKDNLIQGLGRGS